MTSTPDRKLAKIPAKKGTENVNLVISNSTAAATIGVANKKENFAALSLSILSVLATVIVIPDLETPGKAAAIACEVPTNKDCFKVIFS